MQLSRRPAGGQHGLKELAYPINDVAGNRTRFLMLQRGERGDTGEGKFAFPSQRPGALMEALGCLEALGLNMSRIESRPSKRELGEYVFFVDVDLTGEGAAVLPDLVKHLTPLCEHLAHFGAYPSSTMPDD